MSKSFFRKVIFYRILLLTLVIWNLSCGKSPDESFDKGRYEDYNSQDFFPVKGIVFETNTYFSFKYFEASCDIYYMYQVDSVIILEDAIKESNLMGIKEGDFIEVLVHKNDPRINFHNGRGSR